LIKQILNSMNIIYSIVWLGFAMAYAQLLPQHDERYMGVRDSLAERTAYENDSLTVVEPIAFIDASQAMDCTKERFWDVLAHLEQKKEYERARLWLEDGLLNLEVDEREVRLALDVYYKSLGYFREEEANLRALQKVVIPAPLAEPVPSPEKGWKKNLSVSYGHYHTNDELEKRLEGQFVFDFYGKAYWKDNVVGGNWLNFKPGIKVERSSWKVEGDFALEDDGYEWISSPWFSFNWKWGIFQSSSYLSLQARVDTAETISGRGGRSVSYNTSWSEYISQSLSLVLSGSFWEWSTGVEGEYSALYDNSIGVHSDFYYWNDWMETWFSLAFAQVYPVSYSYAYMERSASWTANDELQGQGMMSGDIPVSDSYVLADDLVLLSVYNPGWDIKAEEGIEYYINKNWSVSASLMQSYWRGGEELVYLDTSGNILTEGTLVHFPAEEWWLNESNELQGVQQVLINPEYYTAGLKTGFQYKKNKQHFLDFSIYAEERFPIEESLFWGERGEQVNFGFFSSYRYQY
jgi:hypothetical protein